VDVETERRAFLVLRIRDDEYWAACSMQDRSHGASEERRPDEARAAPADYNQVGVQVSLPSLRPPRPRCRRPRLR
jgi:hypothetical protein